MGCMQSTTICQILAGMGQRISRHFGRNEEVDELPEHELMIKEEFNIPVRGEDDDDMKTEPKVIIAGGEHYWYTTGNELDSVEMFSLSTRTWTQLQPLTESRSAASLVVYNNWLIVNGGWFKQSMEKLSLNDVYNANEFDQFVSTWENLSIQLPAPLSGHQSLVYNGRLIVVGGYDEDEMGACDKITEISLARPYTSKLLTTMPTIILFHGVVLFGDKIVIIGGREGTYSTSCLRNVFMYDVTKNEWQELAPLPYPVYQMGTVKWDDDHFIIMGGVEEKPINKVLMYNIKTQKSHMLPDMKYTRQACVAAVVEDNLIVMGGKSETGALDPSRKVESFRFDRNTWEELPEMHEGRHYASAVVCAC